MECKKEENLKYCPCSYPGCERKGICCLCVKHHREKNELPGCFFPKEIEKTYDRTVENFLRNKKINS
ncbi:MAG: DUF6485 family protein [Candidatus Pacebacteria bacterium]|jgi:hypothetical protein|nr:DUF6485 family protein [Candidatus Paceibacterota bacterium]MDD3072486.1 DUF6485 family protein [Candidatus Paceibacterota bacterium]MDD3729214.1 DUF6485 family protein [Candidatus Paceibacterota bacterium]MDD4201746.1 DUF6485 family protein [Candidatus Paceibacterota bacterium]MDD4466893.1 DUF6485 family protein [Candidatus Paceibacterota bacterium]